MFTSQRRRNAGFGSIGVVGVVLVAWVIGAGVMLKSYADGARSTCQRQEMSAGNK